MGVDRTADVIYSGLLSGFAGVRGMKDLTQLTNGENIHAVFSGDVVKDECLPQHNYLVQTAPKNHTGTPQAIWSCTSEIPADAREDMIFKTEGNKRKEHDGPKLGVYSYRLSNNGDNSGKLGILRARSVGDNGITETVSLYGDPAFDDEPDRYLTKKRYEFNKPLFEY